jgi:hypothetical protein
MREIILNYENSGILNNLSLVASVLRDQKKYKKTEEINRRALEESEKMLRIKYLNILISVNNLALMLQN